MRTKFLAFSSSALLLAFCCAASAQPEKPGHVDPAPGSKSEAVSATKDKFGHAVGVVSAEMTTTTHGFVTAAAGTDLYEVEAAKVALMRSHASGVKQFARSMIAAHTKTTRQLKSIVAGENINVSIPDTLDARHQGMIDDLRGVKDIDFDGRYASQQVDTHNEALILMRGYHDGGDNRALKKFAGTVENAVKMHLSMAQRLDKSIMAHR